MHKVIIILLTIFLLSSCVNQNQITHQSFPETLEDCNTLEDTIYVLDYWSYDENGYLRPPCSLSPDYSGCIKKRYSEIVLFY
jgi:hypothetical protein